MIALGAMIGALIALMLAVLRLLGGPTLQDRALAASAMVEKAVLICAGAVVLGAPSGWLDAAFALLLSSYVANVTILKFFRLGNLQAPLARSREAR